MRKIVLAVMAALITMACTSIDCPVQNTVRTYYNICQSDGKELKLTDTMTVISTRADGQDTSLLDPVLFNKGIDISAFSLPVSYSHPEDVLVFQFDNSNDDFHVADTVWIKKEDYPHFESVDCSASFFHHLTDVRHTHHYIDSLVINNPEVTYDQKSVHFRLYPKTRN